MLGFLLIEQQLVGDSKPWGAQAWLRQGRDPFFCPVRYVATHLSTHGYPCQGQIIS